MLDYYQLLHVSRNASQEEIKRSYHALMKDAHPDTGGSTDYSAILNEAHDVLSHDSRRRDYDRSLEQMAVPVRVNAPITPQRIVTYSAALADELADDLVQHAARVRLRLEAERRKRLG